VSAIEILRVVVTLAASPIVPPRYLPPLPAPAPSTAAASSSESAICSAPFFYSGDGIKRYVMECLSIGGGASDSMVPDCTVPYTFDEAGRHHYIAACMDSVGSPCEVPFTYDSEGTKHYKTSCLGE
jgi:hypothetical protein